MKLVLVKREKKYKSKEGVSAEAEAISTIKAGDFRRIPEGTRHIGGIKRMICFRFIDKLVASIAMEAGIGICGHFKEKITVFS